MATAVKVEKQLPAPAQGGDATARKDGETQDIFGNWVTVKTPLMLDQIFQRLDKELRKRGSTLLAVYKNRYSVTAPVQFDILEAELRDSGRVRLIDMVALAYDCGVIAKSESPQQTWASWPPPF